MSKDKTIRGACMFLEDNIDTDLIIPAQYLNLVPTIPEEYRKLGFFTPWPVCRTHSRRS